MATTHSLDQPPPIDRRRNHDRLEVVIDRVIIVRDSAAIANRRKHVEAALGMGTGRDARRVLAREDVLETPLARRDGTQSASCMQTAADAASRADFRRTAFSFNSSAGLVYEPCEGLGVAAGGESRGAASRVASLTLAVRSRSNCGQIVDKTDIDG